MKKQCCLTGIKQETKKCFLRLGERRATIFMPQKRQFIFLEISMASYLWAVYSTFNNDMLEKN